MKKSENHATTMGLDVGTSRVVLAQRSGEDYHFDSQLNAFVSIPFSKLTASVLEKEGIPHTAQANEIIVHGNESERFAELMNAEIRRTMTHGTLDAKEPESLTLIREIVESLTGTQAGADAKVCFTVPAAPLGAQESVTYHESTLRHMLEDMGYKTKAINEGLAVIYAELEDTNYTGIGVSCGGGLCNVAMSYLSVPVMSFSVAKAGDYIDSSAAAMLGERANRVRIMKEESFHLNGYFGEKVSQVLTVYYDEMISTIVAGLKESFATTRNPAAHRSTTVPLVLSGGTALPAGFRDRFEKAVREGNLQVQISEVRMASSPLNAAAKGALVAGLAEM